MYAESMAIDRSTNPARDAVMLKLNEIQNHPAISSNILEHTEFMSLERLIEHADECNETKGREMSFDKLNQDCIKAYSEMTGRTINEVKSALASENGKGPVTNSVFMLVCDQMTVK